MHVCSNLKLSALDILIVKEIHKVEVGNHRDSVNLAIPKDDVPQKGSLKLLEDKGEQELTQLQT